jgi:hypothetical protein
VKSLLTDGENTLVITIRPAATESQRLKEEHPYSIPALRQMGAIGTYTFVRKPASGELTIQLRCISSVVLQRQPFLAQMHTCGIPASCCIMLCTVSLQPDGGHRHIHICQEASIR